MTHCDLFLKIKELNSELEMLIIDVKYPQNMKRSYGVLM